MATINQNLQELRDVKQAIKEAIIYQRQPILDSDSFMSYAEKIRAINYDEEIERAENLIPTDHAEGENIQLSDSAPYYFKAFDIKGNSIQEGTPTLDNEVPVNGAGDDGNITERIVGKQLFQLEYIPIPNSPINAFLKKGTYAIATCDGLTFNKNIYIKLFDKYKNIVTTGGHLTTGANLSFSSSSYNYYGAAGISSFVFTLDEDYYLSIGLLESNNTRQIMLVKGEEIDRTFQAYKEKTYTIPVQQPMRSIGTLRDEFIQDENGNWFERHYIQRKTFNGGEGITKISTSSNIAYSYSGLISYVSKPLNNITVLNTLSNYFKGEYSANDIFYNNNIGLGINNTGVLLIGLGLSSTITTVADFKAKLQELYEAGKPIYIDYPLATPIDLRCTEEQIIALNAKNKLESYEGITNIETINGTPSYKEIKYRKIVS